MVSSKGAGDPNHSGVEEERKTPSQGWMLGDESPPSTDSTPNDPSFYSPAALHPLPSRLPRTAAPIVLPLAAAPSISPAPVTLLEPSVLLLQG